MAYVTEQKKSCDAVKTTEINDYNNNSQHKTLTVLWIPSSPSVSSQVDLSAFLGNSEMTDFNSSSTCKTAVISPPPTHKHKTPFVTN